MMERGFNQDDFEFVAYKNSTEVERVHVGDLEPLESNDGDE